MLRACSDYRLELSSYLDEQLDDLKRADIAQHLATCKSCKSELEDLRLLSSYLSQGKAPDSPDLWESLSGKLGSVCAAIEEDLSAYLDRELSPEAFEGMNKHLQDCFPCRQKFKHLNATNQLLSMGLALPANIKVDLWTLVKSRLNEDCALIQSELSAFVDQEVATLRHRSITAHLLDCPTCRSLFERLSEMGDLICRAYFPKLQANFDLWPSIKAKLEVIPFPVTAKTQPRLLAQRLYLVGAAAVVVVMAGLLAFFVLGPRTSGIQPVSAESYLLESALTEPTESVEAVVYEEP